MLDDLPDPRAGVPAFEEREAVRVEQGAAALRQGERAAGAVGGRPVVDEAEQDEKLRSGAEALVHGVRVERGVFAQTFVEAGERVVAEEDVVLRQGSALLGMEQEDETENDGEEGAVDVVPVAVLGERLAKQILAGGVMGGPEPPEQLVEGVQHLFREAFAHLVLLLAAVLEEGGEPLAARQREETLFGEEEAEGGAEGPAGGEAHVRGPEVHPAGVLAARGGDEAEGDAVEEEAGRNPGTAKQAFGAALGEASRRRGPAAPTPTPALPLAPVLEGAPEETGAGASKSCASTSQRRERTSTSSPMRGGRAGSGPAGPLEAGVEPSFGRPPADPPCSSAMRAAPSCSPCGRGGGSDDERRLGGVRHRRRYPSPFRRSTSRSTPTGQWSEPCSSGQMKAPRTRSIASGEAST